MKALPLAFVFGVIGAQAHADKWPEHGFYQVVDRIDHGQRSCEMQAELNVDGKVFALVIREGTTGALMVQFLTQVPGIDKAEQVIVGLDRKEILRFTPTVRDNSSELPSVAGFIPSDLGGPIIERLQQAANGAHWLQVVALPYSKAVPANGLKEAMDDLVACRTARKI